MCRGSKLLCPGEREEGRGIKALTSQQSVILWLQVGYPLTLSKYLLAVVSLHHAL